MKCIFFIISIFIFSCGNPKEKKEESIDNTDKVKVNVDLRTKNIKDSKLEKSRNKEVLIDEFFNLFLSDFVSVRDFENVFGSYAVEQEELFFEDCESKNSMDYCNKVFDKCMDNPNTCESLIFLKIRNILKKDNVIHLKNILKEASDNKYLVNVNGNKYQFTFTANEQGEWIVNDFFINDKSIFSALRSL